MVYRFRQREFEIDRGEGVSMGGRMISNVHRQTERHLQLVAGVTTTTV
jgi:hypothetical protein